MRSRERFKVGLDSQEDAALTASVAVLRDARFKSGEAERFVEVNAGNALVDVDEREENVLMMRRLLHQGGCG